MAPVGCRACRNLVPSRPRSITGRLRQSAHHGDPMLPYLGGVVASPSSGRGQGSTVLNGDAERMERLRAGGADHLDPLMP
jgi:hypothetical protein